MGQSNSSHSKSEVRPSKSKNDSKSKHRDNCSKDKLKTFSCLAPGQNDESIYYSMGGGSKNKQFNNQNSNGKEQVQQKSGSIKKSTSLFSRKKNNQEEQQIAESYCNTQLSGSKSNVQVIDQVSLQKTDQQTLNMIKHLKLDQGSLDKAPMQVRLRDNQMKAQQQPIKIKGGMTSNTQSSTKQVQNQQIQQFNTQSNGGSSRNHTTQLASQQSSEYSIKNSRSPFNLKRYKESADKQDRKDIAKSKGYKDKVLKSNNILIKGQNDNFFNSQSSKVPKCCHSCTLQQPFKCWRKFVREELMGKEEFNSCKWRRYILHIADTQREDNHERLYKSEFFKYSDNLIQQQQQTQQNLNETQRMISPLKTLRTLTVNEYDSIISQKTGSSKYTNDEESVRETGQSVLKQCSNFHEQVLLIKNQLLQNKHPITQIINLFKTKFYSQNFNLLQKQNFEDSRSYESSSSLSAEQFQASKSRREANTKILKNCNKQIHFFVDLIVRVIIAFYQLNVKSQDIKRDLIVNLVTRFILSDEVYFLMFNLISIHFSRDLHKLTTIMQNKNVQDTMLNFDALKVKPQFSYNEQCRLRYKKLEDNLDSSFIQLESDEFAFNSLTSGPYQDTIQSFLKILQMESPMCKLEQIYSSCTQTLIREQENFWSGFDISKKDLFIDSDNLQGILIYIVSRINYPQIWTELHLIEEYIPDAVQMSNRAFYMVMLKASCEYLINLKVPKTQQIQRPPSIHQSPMITEENEEDSDGEQQATAQSYSMKQFQLNFDQVRRRNISLIISKTSYSARALRIPRNNNHVLLDDEEVGSLQHLGDQNNQNQVVLIGDYNTSSADLNMIDKLNQTHADAYFFDNNCILQDDLIDKIKQQVNKAHMYTVIDTTPSTQSLTSTENTRY